MTGGLRPPDRAAKQSAHVDSPIIQSTKSDVPVRQEMHLDVRPKFHPAGVRLESEPTPLAFRDLESAARGSNDSWLVVPARPALPCPEFTTQSLEAFGQEMIQSEPSNTNCW